MTHWFALRDTDFDYQHQTWLEATGMEPDNDRQHHALALERADRVREHGPLPMTARPAQPPARGARLIASTRWYSPDELAAQMAVRPRSGQVTPLGTHIPEEEDAA